jgi:hypothetical protein
MSIARLPRELLLLWKVAWQAESNILQSAGQGCCKLLLLLPHGAVWAAAAATAAVRLVGPWRPDSNNALSIRLWSFGLSLFE